MNKIKKGSNVWIEVRGAGVVSYEPAVVEKVSKGKVFLENGDYPFDLDSRGMISESQGVFGFYQYLVRDEIEALDKREFRRALTEEDD